MMYGQVVKAGWMAGRRRVATLICASAFCAFSIAATAAGQEIDASRPPPTAAPADAEWTDVESPAPAQTQSSPRRPADAESRYPFARLHGQAYGAWGDHSEAIDRCARAAAAAALEELEGVRNRAAHALAEVVRIGGRSGPVFDEGTRILAEIDQYISAARARRCALPPIPNYQPLRPIGYFPSQLCEADKERLIERARRERDRAASNRSAAVSWRYFFLQAGGSRELAEEQVSTRTAARVRAASVLREIENVPVVPCPTTPDSAQTQPPNALAAPQRPAAAQSRYPFASLGAQAYHAWSYHSEAIGRCDRVAAAAGLAELNRLRRMAAAALADVVRIGGPPGPVLDEGSRILAEIDQYISAARALRYDCGEPVSVEAAPVASVPPSPAEPTRIVNSGPAASAGMSQSLEAIVAQDASGWLSNRYSAGSMRNVALVEGSETSGTFALRGDYTYNDNLVGWVIARFRNGEIHCLQYHDIGRTCRTPNTP